MAINKELVGKRKGDLLRIDVPEWQGVVWARKIQLGQMTNINKYADDSIKQTVVALIEILVDEDGVTPIFTRADYDFLMREEVAVITNIFNKCMEFNTVDYNKKKES